MSRGMKSQWEFGELFPAESTRKVWTVGEITTSIKRVLETQIGLVWVTGEVSNFRAQSSGHAYFSLKDGNGQLNCVLFRGTASAEKDLLRDGQKVVVQGDLTVYEPRGQYQLVVRRVELQGVGALQLAFERLKQKLAAEGLFDPARKRPIPKFPRCLGLVTSPTGAAIRDVLHVVARRNPSLLILLAPSRVQGLGAAEEVASAVGLLNEWAVTAPEGQRPELILVTRGGGSLEDLWSFNEEVLARAIAGSQLPVVSAVGHEIDFTISDFVADLRAATPSAAAEIITEGMFASSAVVAQARERIAWLARRRWEEEAEGLEQWRRRLGRAHPRRRLNENWQRMDDLEAGLTRAWSRRVKEFSGQLGELRARLQRARPSAALTRSRSALAQAVQRLDERLRAQWETRRGALAQAHERLRLLSPENVLERGYSITMDDATGKVIRASDEVAAGQRIKTRLKKGAVRSVVEAAVG